MNNAKSVWAFAVMIAILVALSPLVVWQVLFADPMFDSVFSSSFGGMPVMKGGRIMPLSSAATDVLKSISGKSTTKVDGKKVSATKWLWLLNADSDRLSSNKVFRTDNRELQKILGSNGRNYSYDDVAKNYDEIEKLSLAKSSTHLSKAAAEALNSALAYAVASNAFSVKLPEASSAKAEIENWRKAIATATEELKLAKDENRTPNHAKLAQASKYLDYFQRCVAFEASYPDAVLNTIEGADNSTFATPARSLLDKTISNRSDNILNLYAESVDSIRNSDYKLASEKLFQLDELLKKSEKIDFIRLRVEHFTNAFSPFFSGFILYILALISFGLAGLWQKKYDFLLTFGVVFSSVALILHILGIVLRMYIQMRPPVTNLYSSIVFTGCAATAIGLYIYFRRGFISCAVVSCIAGMLSLLIAINLPYSGDTMGMMRAVLNSNFWLTAHVMTIMVGYCGVFLAGFLAEFRLIGNLFSKSNFGIATTDTAKTVYSLLCFGLLFSFAGTMLGGIWADMSWGRFWGWDPKENGALMVVLWCAVVIHAKVLRLCSDRAFLAMTVFGNVIAAWAWFGVNLLGVGLHAYGFISGGWFWFFAFVLSQLLIIPLYLVKYKGN